VRRVPIKLIALVAVIMLFSTQTALAVPPPDKLDHHSTTPQACAGDGATILANITEDVLNVIDSGFGGNWWAHDDLNRHFQIWQVAENDYCVAVGDTGMSTTYAGTSPSGYSTVSEGVTGSIVGGYVVSVHGTFNAGNLPTDGYLGTFDRECDPDTSSCPGFYQTWTNYFETGFTWDYVDWGWVYKAGNNGTWLNQDNVAAADSGDITD